MSPEKQMGMGSVRVGRRLMARGDRDRGPADALRSHPAQGPAMSALGPTRAGVWWCGVARMSAECLYSTRVFSRMRAGVMGS